MDEQILIYAAILVAVIVLTIVGILLSRVLWNSSGYIRRNGKERCRLRPGRPHGL